MRFPLASSDPWGCAPQAVFSGCSALVGCRAPNPATDYPEGLACLGGKCRSWIFNTLLLNVFFSFVSRGNNVWCCIYIYYIYICIRQKGYSWSYRRWVLKNMNKTKIRVQYVLWFCSSIWGKDSLTPLKLSPFHALHTGKWVERQDLFCTTAQHSLWIIIWLCEVSQLEITNNNDMTAEGWCPLTPPERCQFKSLD